jgi:RNA-binding protein
MKLRRAGVVNHISGTGFIVVKANPDSLPKIGAEVVNRRTERIGLVYDIIGPVRSPFLLIKPRKKGLKNLVSEELFVVGDDNGRNRKGKGNRKERNRKRIRKG